MQSISYDTAKQNKLIRFMTPGMVMDTEDAFYIKNGDRLRITSGYNGRETSHICTYIDPTHFQVGNTLFHMDQFSEVMGQNGSKYEPENPITDFSLYEKKYCDRTLKNESGQLIPYHEIIIQYEPHRYDRPLLSIAVCPDADALRTVCITQWEGAVPDRTFLSFARLQDRISEDLYSTLNHWDRRTLSAIVHDFLCIQQTSSLTRKIEAASCNKIPFIPETQEPHFGDFSR